MALDNEIIVQEQLLSRTAEVAYQQQKLNITQLIENAKNFLQEINFINKNLLKLGLQEQAKALVNDLNTQSSIYSSIAIFEAQINLFLGRTIYLTYVTKQGDLKLYDDFEIFQIYSEIHQYEKGKGKIRANDQLNIYQQVQNTSLMQKIQNSLLNKKRVYTQAIRRFNKKADSTGKKGMSYKARNEALEKTFYYRLFDSKHITDWSIITNRGQIAQAYAGAVISEDNTINDNSLEWSLYHLDNRLETENKINSEYGLLKGDVQLNGQIQFAIKSQNLFNAPAIRQYITFAYNILFFKDIFLQNPEKIQKNLKQLINIQVSSKTMAKQLLEVAGKGSAKKIKEYLESKDLKVIFNI